MRGVLFDARWIRSEMTGVGMVAYHILRAIPLAERSNHSVILPEGSLHAFELEGFHIFYSRIRLEAHPWTDLFEQFAIPWLCYRHRFKNFVSFEGRTPAWHFGFKTFAYIHDATFIRYWRFNGLKYSALLFFHLFIAKYFATGILTVSEDAKGKLTRLARLPSSRLHVVPNAGSGLDVVSSEKPAWLGETPFFIAVGMGNPRKNLDNLIRAFRLFNEKNDSCLVITGAGAALQKKISEQGDRGVISAGFVQPGELRYLYENALALIYPSLDEGFGIPLVDASCFKCPVICSDIPVFHEVLGDGATYFDPQDPISIANALTRVPAYSSVAAQRYSWERSSATLLDILSRSSRK